MSFVAQEVKVTSSERIRRAKEIKKEKNRAKFSRYLEANRDSFNKRRRAKYQEQLHEEKKINDEEKRVYRKRKSRAEAVNNIPNEAFKHREGKRRAVMKVRSLLPSTPEKRADIVESLNQSPTTRAILESRSILTSEEEKQEVQVGRAILNDVSSAVSAVKGQRSKDTVTAVKVGLAFLCGDSVSANRLKSRVAERINISRQRLAQGTKHRQSALKQNLPWLDSSRKARSDTVSQEIKEMAYEFWASPEISRPSPNKKDIIRERVASKTYIEHEKQLLEKSQSEVYLEFKQKYPELKIGQRTFEKCKPFFVKQAREQDRVSCCCRTHVETRMLFAECMKFRKMIVSKMHLTDEQLSTQPQFQIHSHLTDAVQQTLCQKEEHCHYNKKSCLYRECKECGVDKLKTLPEENDKSSSAPCVKWEKFQYVVCGTDSNGKEKKRLQIVSMETSPGEMFEYFKNLLKGFPAHQFRASWQHEQFKALMSKLPLHHACCVHDYSENYNCRYQEEAQSLYFAQNQCSIHVTILYRHASLQCDGVESTEDNPKIITEHLFVISPDLKHDHHSVHQCRQLVADHLKECGGETEVLHEWTDGCSAQYKSRHCMGDVSFSEQDFDFKTIRNYMETSHAKGPQDGAGGNIKHMADLDVIRGKVRIQNAHDFYEHMKQNYSDPAISSFQSRTVQLSKRLFFYIENNNRNRAGRSFREVVGNRQIHSIKAGGSPGSLLTRHLSCYCDNCLDTNEEECCNKQYVESWKAVGAGIEPVPGRPVTRSEDTEEHLKDLVRPNDTIAIAAADRGEDYYLMKITGSGKEILKRTERDAYNCRYRVGSEVFRGYFYVRHHHNVLEFTLDNNREAIVFSETVRYICTGLQQHYDQCEDVDVFRLNEQEHLDILDCLNPV